MSHISAPVIIEANPAINPTLPVAMAGATPWLRMNAPGLSPHTQTLGGGVSPVQAARSPGTRQAGFAGGHSPSSAFTLTVHGSGRVTVVKASSPTAAYGSGAKAYPLPSGLQPASAAQASGPHIVGGGAALFNGVVGVNGDLVVWGKIYAPGDTHPPQTFRGNPSASTAELQDVEYFHGTAATTSVPYYAGLTVATGSATSFSCLTDVGLTVSTQTITYVSGVTVSATIDPDTCVLSVTAHTTTATQDVVVGVTAATSAGTFGAVSAGATVVTGITWTSAGTVDVLRGISASSSAGTTPKIVIVS